MLYNHRHNYWIFIIIILCLSSHITQCNYDHEDDVEDEFNEGDERNYWRTFASVAGKVASKAGDTVYSAASTGANTITSMFDDDDDDNEDDKNNCDEDGCVETDKTVTGVERTDGIFNTVTSTVSSAWSSTKEATGAALDGVRNTIAGEVDAVLGALGNRIATALSPEYLITKGLSFLPSQLLSTIVFLISLLLAYVIASFVSIFTAIAFLMAVYLIHAVTGPLWIISMMLLGLDYTFWMLKCLVFYPRISAVVIGLVFMMSIYWFYLCPFVEDRRRRRKMDVMDDNVRILMDTVDDIQRRQQEIFKMVQALHNKQILNK